MPSTKDLPHGRHEKGRAAWHLGRLIPQRKKRPSKKMGKVGQDSDSGGVRDEPALGIDQRGIPTHECLSCGCDTFRIIAKFEDYEIAWWALNGYCYMCDSPVTVPCPADRVEL